MRNSQSPSIYSIYQNALPFYLDRADICVVADEESELAAGFIGKLLQGGINLQVDASNLSADKLRHLYFESRNLEKTSGAKTFAFGYPMVIDTFEGELMVSPLFIWHLTIEPAQTKVDAWVLRFDEQHQVLPNYHFLHFLKEKYDLDWRERMESKAFNRQVNYHQLHEIADELALRLHFENLTGEGDVIPCPGIDEIGALTESGTVHWSGVLGLFPPQHNRWKPGDEKPEEVFVETPAEAEYDDFVYPYLAADPEQMTALETVARQQLSVVEGIDVLGKTQTLVNLLINALSQGKRCLVVSERAPALKSTQDALARSGLNQLHFLLDDALSDKLPLLELLRVAASGGSRSVNFNESDFQQKKNKYLREKAKLNAAYEAVRKNVFSDYNWTETVGLFLSNHRIAGRELLASHLNRQDFSFNDEEYGEILRGVVQCHPLFQKVKTLSHPLSNLHDKVFQQVSADDGRTYVEQQLNIFLGKAAKLQHRYINEINTYGTRLRNHYQEHAQELDNQLEAVNEKILDYSDQLGTDFRQAGAGTFHLPFLFSKKKKKIAKAQQEVAKRYRQLVTIHGRRPYVDFRFGPAKEGSHIPNVIDNLTRFSEALEEWKDKIESTVHEEVMRLNSKTAHPSLDVKEQVTHLEYSLDLLLEELNESELYRKKLENKTLTVPQRQKYLESIIEQLETTQLNLRDFQNFYEWQHKWLSLSPLGRKVIVAMVKVKPKDWTAAFNSWYFNNLLVRHQSDDLPQDGDFIVEYDHSWHALRPLLLNQVIQLWQQKQSEAVKQLRRKNKRKFNLIFERSGHKKAAGMPLDQVFDEGMEAVAAFLPVLFVTPHVALNVVPSNFRFDYVIFTEANRFSVETATAISSMGDKVVIFGSNDNNGSETSLLQYAMENGVPSTSITNKYEVPDNRQGQLVKSAERPFFFAGSYFVESLEGRFHELEGTNDVEAQHIIRLLNQVKQTPQRIYPSVGIVTFTIEQRDLIAGYLLKLKQQNATGSEKIRQLERNGMGVFYIEELFGQQFDILIVSCTYGMVNIKGSLTKKMKLLNSPEGLSHMHLLINKPVHQLHLIHSFSDSHLEKLRGKAFEEGTWLLANLIQLAEASKNNNEPLFESTLEVIGKRKPQDTRASVFVNEVVNSLDPYLENERLQYNVLRKDIVLPLTVAPVHGDQPVQVIHPDGFFADTAFTSGVWEYQHTTDLESAGISYYPVWSLNWLKEPSQEARRLASQIIKTDGLFRPEEATDGLEEEKNEVDQKDREM